MKSRPVVLIADDDERVRTSLSEILLAKRYKVVIARDGRETLEKVESESPDVILLDIGMPEINGIEVIKDLKKDDEKKLIPIVVVSGQDDVGLRIQALKLGADDFLIKPPHFAELIARVQTLTKVKAYNDYMTNYQKTLEKEVRNRTEQLNIAREELKNASLETVYRLSRAAEYKDEDTAVHIQRMSNYVATIAENIGLNKDKKEALLYSSPMHDIGKIGIPDRILLKPGKLNNKEWEIMKRHTLFGENILKGSKSSFIKLGRTIALTHHEKWDGSGYPNGLKRDEIPIEGRIAALADVFDALTSKRPYKEAFTNEKAYSILKENRGSHFDPELVDVFFDLEEKIIEIQKLYNDEAKSVLLELAGENT